MSTDIGDAAANITAEKNPTELAGRRRLGNINVICCEAGCAAWSADSDGVSVSPAESGETRSDYDDDDDDE